MVLGPEAYETDGVLGWLVVLGAFLTNLVYGASTRAFGVLYLMLQENFPKSELVISGVGALNLVTIGIGGLPSAWLCKPLSFRLVGLLGAVITLISFLLAANAQDLTMLYIWYGLCNGLGMSLVYTCSFLAVDAHFEKYKIYAMGLAVGGSGVGAFIFPPIFETIRHKSDEACFLCLAGLSSSLILTIILYRKPGEGIVTDLGLRSCCKAISNSVCKTKNRLLAPKPSDEPRLTNYKTLDESKEYDTLNGDTSSIPGHPGKIPKSDETNREEKTGHIVESSDSFWDCKMLCNVGVVVLLVQNVSAQAFTAFDSMYTPAFAISQGVSQMRASWMLSTTGISGIVIPLILCVIIDNPCCHLDLLVVINTATALGAGLQLVFPISTKFVVLVVLCSLKSGLVNSFLTQRATMAGRIGGVKNMEAVLGMSLVAEAVGSLIGRTAGGAFKDFYGHYHYGYYLTGSLLLITSLLFQAVFCDPGNEKGEQKGT